MGQCSTVEHPISANHGQDEVIGLDCVLHRQIRIPQSSDVDEHGSVDVAPQV